MAERVARTDDLRPIPVVGGDELARLTEAFNMMLRALAESIAERQARLVTDAGHELRTPLTSLRTNVELLMASQVPGAPPIPEAEMADLRGDVIGQIEELSTLVGDLVDLSRDDASGVVHEQVDISETVDRCLEQVRRRRNDIEFDVHITPWLVYGDPAALSRAVLNLPRQRRQVEPTGRPGVVALWPRWTPTHAEMVVSDLGPGFPRSVNWCSSGFYRSDTGAGDAGSGLGLAIVKHGGGAQSTAVRCGGGTPCGAGGHRARRSTSGCPVNRFTHLAGRRRQDGNNAHPGVVPVDSQSTRAR